ncbi:hypothetical protein PHYPSEUDO_013944 [Phytophthora pseudosyringae]|uniref:Uncharacterized protein n=1 Tax=Phytophthora pseudosyringae TaxID=221518 RepID=A0A8T1W5T7_9STRA|nr:hypothetical protein PHYPSEUDO_013944 [Phytophthora pseudosyringae]
MESVAQRHSNPAPLRLHGAAEWLGNILSSMARSKIHRSLDSGARLQLQSSWRSCLRRWLPQAAAESFRSRLPASRRIIARTVAAFVGVAPRPSVPSAQLWLVGCRAANDRKQSLRIASAI